MQEGFFQIPFPHQSGAVSSYSILARYIPKNYKSGNSPHSLLTAAFVLVSVKIFLPGSKDMQRSTQNRVSKSCQHFCDVAQDQVGNAGLDLCSCSSQFRSNDFQGYKTPYEFLWTQTSGPFIPNRVLCNAVQFVWQNNLELRFLASVIKVAPSIKLQ